MPWTEELISDLVGLWSKGLSTAEIGRRLGVTKNAVVGKAHRLALEPRPSPIIHRAKPVDTYNGPRCQWPEGHPGEAEFHFCSAPVVEGRPYCPDHCRRAYMPPKPASDKAAARRAA